VASPTLSGDDVTIHYSSSNAVDDGTYYVFALSGANTTTPFDTNSSLPGSATGAGSTEPGPFITSSTVSTSSADDYGIAIGSIYNGTSTSAALGDTDVVPSGMSETASQTNLGATYADVSALAGGALSSTLSAATAGWDFTNSTVTAWDLLFEAVQPASSGGGCSTTTTAATTTTTHATTTTTHATTTTTASTTTTTTTPPTGISAVGSWKSNWGTGIDTLSVSPSHVGDEMLLIAAGGSTTLSVVSVSGGKTSWSSSKVAGGAADGVELWTGTVTSTGSSTITVTWSGSVAGNWTEIDAQEFSPGTGYTWAVDGSQSGFTTGTSTTVDFPSLTAASSNELYYGYAIAGDDISSGSSSGFTYATNGDGSVEAYDTTASGTLAPTAPNPGDQGWEALAVMFVVTSTSPPSTTTTTHATTTTTAATTTTTSGSGSGTATTYMVDLTGGVLLEVTGSTETWYYPNLEGGTAAEASSTGAAVGGITLYDPFGNALTSLQADSPDDLAYGFEGKNGIGTDTDAGGIVLMGARLYSPMTGRFLQVDPVFGGNCNAYDYVCQDPLNKLDLNGNSAEKCTAERQLCLNVSGKGTNVTGISATVTFPTFPGSSDYYVGCTITIEVLIPEQYGQYQLEYIGMRTLRQEDVVGNPPSWTAIDPAVPDTGQYLPDGTVIKAYLTNPQGQVMATASATVKAHPFLWGAFS
jgi:RHS repeat-associated protein